MILLSESGDYYGTVEVSGGSAYIGVWGEGASGSVSIQIEELTGKTPCDASVPLHPNDLVGGVYMDINRAGPRMPIQPYFV